jgi:MATE family multidrug resistance protein
MLPLIALILSIDGIQVTLSGVVKGVGKQSFGAKAVVGAFYVIGLPVILYLSFSCNLQIYGIWIGSGVASVILDFVYMWALKNMDFRAQAEEIAQNMEKNEIELEERLL